MKRSSSSSKQSMLKSSYKKTSYRHKPNDFSHLSSTLSVFPFDTPLNHQFKTNDKQFYNTFLGNQLMIDRPESKQAFRKFISRPQTSKGSRPNEPKLIIEQNKQGIFHSQWTQNRPSKVGQRSQQSTFCPDIEIVVNRSKKHNKQNYPTRSKFQTDLDDEFLQLFAN